MRRPLLAVCLCALLLLAVRLYCGPPKAGNLSESEAWPDKSLVTVKGQVYQKDQESFYLKSVFFQKDTADSKQWISMEDNLICEYAGEMPAIGSEVTLQGEYYSFLRATNPGEFDARSYYQTLEIGGRLRNVTVLQQGEEYSVVGETLYDLRMYFRERLYRIFPEKEASVMSAMLLGDKKGLDPEVKSLYQENGIIHILSISGLHITLIGMGIYQVLRRIGVPVWLCACMGGVILFLYGVMTGMSVSAARAIGMYLIRMLAEVTGRTYDMMTALGVMALWLAVGNPLNLQNAGYLLSFGAVTGIAWVYPAFLTGDSRTQSGNREQAVSLRHSRWAQILVRQSSGVKGFVIRTGIVFLDGLQQSVCSGLAMTLTTLPIQLWFYYEVPVYSVLVNLLVVPCMSAVMCSGLIAMLVPGLGIIGTVDCVILGWYEWVCECFERLPFSTWNPGRPDGRQVILYYLLLIGFVLCQKAKGRKSKFEKCEFKERKNREGNWQKWLPVIMSVLLLGVIGSDWNRYPSVTFLDVGQGDCIVIQVDSDEALLFDCGSTGRSKVGEYVLKPYLKYRGIRELQAVFLSHPDADHCNGVVELLQNREEWNLRVEQLILPALEPELLEEEFGEVLKLAAPRTVVQGSEAPVDVMREAEAPVLCESALGLPMLPDVKMISAGMSWQTAGISFLCLHPPREHNIEDSNAYSQCFYVRFPEGAEMLLTGDVEAEGESMLLEALKDYQIREIDVLKVAHHGSRYSGKTELLEQLSPTVAVISCGRNNRYGHPHKETLERLEGVGSKVLTTSEYGAITMEVGKSVVVRTFCGEVN